MDTPATHLIEAARELLRAEGYFVDLLWHASDILTICEDRAWPAPAPAECAEIFARFHAEFDGEHGLSWPRLEETIHQYLILRGGLIASARNEMQPA